MEKKTDFKSMTKKAKVQYVWDYYRWHILITLIVSISLISIVKHFVTYREPLLNVIMANCNDTLNADPSGFNEFFEEYGYDADSDLVSLAASLNFPEEGTDEDFSSYNDYQLLVTLIAAGQEDVFFGRGPVYLNYAEEGVLADLSTVLPAETLEKYEDYLVYSTNNGETEPYPCAIELVDNKWLQKNHYYTSCHFGIFVQSANDKTTLDFTEFLLNYE